MESEREVRVNLQALAALCEAATPGPWEAVESDVPWVVVPQLDGIDLLIAECEQANGHNDVEFIAAADPSTVLALVRVAEACTASGCRCVLCKAYWGNEGDTEFHSADCPLAALSALQETGGEET